MGLTAAERQAEIYLITTPGYWYVGCTTVGYKQRLRQHSAASSGCVRLRDKIRELGLKAFTVSVLETVRREDAHEAELRWYYYFLDLNHGENLNSHRPGAYPEPTPERNAKLSRALKGRVFTEASRQRMSVAAQGNTSHLGITHTEEARYRMGTFHRAKTHCPQLHPYDDNNTYITKDGKRQCRTCARERARAS